MGFNDGIYSMKYDGEPPLYQYCECCNFLRVFAVTHLLEHIISDLVEMIDYMGRQSRINFYASSLLIAYDSTKLNSISHCTRHRGTSHISPIPVNSDVIQSKAEHTCLKEKYIKIDMNEYRIRNEHSDANLNETILGGYAARLSKSTHAPMCKSVHIPYSLKMIDFGHTYIDMEHSRSIDSNYLFGLTNLLEYFKRMTREI